MSKADRIQKLLPFAPGLLVLAFLLLLPLFADLFTLVNSTYWLISGILALSLTFLWGIGGILSLGQTIFFGLAGYSYGVVVLNFSGVGGTVFGLFVGVIVAAIASTLLGYFMFYGRVASLYIAIVTLATSLIFYNLFISTSGNQYAIGQAALGGFNGMQQIPTLLNLDITFNYLLVVVISAIILASCMWLRRSFFGRVFNAVRVNEERTELLGYDVRSLKLIGFVIAGAIAGLAGVLHASWGNTINPTVFNLERVTLVAIWVMVGGRSKLWGAFLGASLIQYLSNFLGTTAQQATPLILGSILILIVLLLPEGIAPALENLWYRFVPGNSQFNLPNITNFNPQSQESFSVNANENYIKESDILKVKNLKCRFGKFWAIDGVDLEFQAGKAYSIIGPNGAGKSTFFNLLTGRLTPTEGQIIYDGEDITKLMPHDRAQRGISIKLQTPNIYQELSVYENLWLAVSATQRITKKHSKIVEIAEKINLPERLNSLAGELSHGEKQWLEIGMASVSNPRLILLDEPTAGMSRGETRRTVELVKELAKISTVIVVEHDMEFVRQLGAIVTVLATGKVFASGAIESIQQDDRVLEIYLGKFNADN